MNREMKKKYIFENCRENKKVKLRNYEHNVTQCEKSNKYVTVKIPTDVDFLFYNS